MHSIRMRTARLLTDEGRDVPPRSLILHGTTPPPPGGLDGKNQCCKNQLAFAPGLFAVEKLMAVRRLFPFNDRWREQ